MSQVLEANYPLSFRAADAAALGTHIRQHNSISLIGMKRVGISNFLRFFLNHPEVVAKYIETETGVLTSGNSNQHLFVVVDLNNLVERSLYAFWMLTLKRLVDAIETSDFPEEMKEQSRSAFAQSIQLRDSFFTLETVRKLLNQMTQHGKYVTLFLLRFDRLKDVINQEFFANIQGLKDHAKQLSYVFTSYRPLYELVPEVFTRSELSVFLQEMYVKPAESQDMKTILATFQKRYDLPLTQKLIDALIELAGGHVQYLQLSLITLKDLPKAQLPTSASELTQILNQEEQIGFLSEELFSSLTKNEQEALTKSVQDENYLIETGIVEKTRNWAQAEKENSAEKERSATSVIFNPLFASYVGNVASNHHHAAQEFTKKEVALFDLLRENAGNLVERETIVTAVWPEEAEFGVSDWSIDRLISRVRTKLRTQKSQYKIVTVITRGYKLVSFQS